MFRLNNLLLFFFIFFLNTQQLSANEKIAFINLEKILSTSNLGKSLLREIQNQNNENIDELKKNEIELKNDQDQLNKIKNIISEDEYKNKLNLLEQKINNFRNKKNQMVEEIEQKRNLELENFFSKINPIIQDYMNKNSIDILFDQKNVFIGKSSSDITDLLIKEINKKFN
tara:strand:- start:736 stop:1248 length:513 start_codon:yes stop_codon:yes gene_type:complete